MGGDIPLSRLTGRGRREHFLCLRPYNVKADFRAFMAACRGGIPQSLQISLAEILFDTALVHHVRLDAELTMSRTGCSMNLSVL